MTLLNAFGNDRAKTQLNFDERDVVVFHDIVEHDHLQQNRLVRIAQPFESGCVQSNFDLVLKFGRNAVFANANVVFLSKGNGPKHIDIVSSEAVAFEGCTLSLKSELDFDGVFGGHKMLFL